MDVFGQLKKAQLENTTTNPSKRGEISFNTSVSKVKYSDGSNSRTVVNTDEEQTLTNKTLTSPTITTPSGIVKGDVGLGSVDNTSDADKPVSTAQAAADTSVANAAALALSNHASAKDTHGVTGDLVGTTDTQTLTNKTLEDPIADGSIILKNNSVTPSNPSSGNKKLYSKNGGLYFLTDAGVEVELVAPDDVVDGNKIRSNMAVRYFDSVWIDGGESGDAENMYGVAWSPELKILSAVGDDDSGSRNGFYSYDANFWQAITTDSNDVLNSVCWASSLSKFIAVGSGAIKYSSDGKAYSDVTTSFAATLWFNKVCWSQELGLLVAVGYDTDSDDPALYTSEDGLIWTEQSVPNPTSSQDIVDICWSPELNLFAAIALQTPASDSLIITSPDGETWTTRSITGAGMETTVAASIAWSKTINKFLVIGSEPWWSSDGTTWESVSGSNWAGYGYSLYWIDELKMFIALSGPSIKTSFDGSHWISRTTESDKVFGGPSSVCWSDELGQLIGVGEFAVWRSR